MIAIFTIHYELHMASKTKFLSSLEGRTEIHSPVSLIHKVVPGA